MPFCALLVSGENLAVTRKGPQMKRSGNFDNLDRFVMEPSPEPDVVADSSMVFGNKRQHVVSPEDYDGDDNKGFDSDDADGIVINVDKESQGETIKECQAECQNHDQEDPNKDQPTLSPFTFEDVVELHRLRKEESRLHRRQSYRKVSQVPFCTVFATVSVLVGMVIFLIIVRVVSG